MMRAVALGCLLSCAAGFAEAATGRLLSDNAGDWGPAVHTGVSYCYDTVPDRPPDVAPDASKLTRRLLDGRHCGAWPVGTDDLLIVTFDFQAVCTFSRVDLATTNEDFSASLECASSAEGPWTNVWYARQELCEEQDWMQCEPEGAEGRFLRVSVTGVAPLEPGEAGVTLLDEVVVWGHSEPRARPCGGVSAFAWLFGAAVAVRVGRRKGREG